MCHLCVHHHPGTTRFREFRLHTLEFYVPERELVEIEFSQQLHLAVARDYAAHLDFERRVKREFFRPGELRIVRQQFRCVKSAPNLKILFPIRQVPGAGCDEFAAPVADSELFEIELLTLKRKPAIEIVKLIIFTQERARKQMAALHPQRSRSGQIDLEREVQLGLLTGKTNLSNLGGEESQKLLLPCLTRLRAGCQFLRQFETARVHQCSGRLQPDPEHDTRRLPNFNPAREKIDPGLKPRDPNSPGFWNGWIDRDRNLCIMEIDGV